MICRLWCKLFGRIFVSTDHFVEECVCVCVCGLVCVCVCVCVLYQQRRFPTILLLYFYFNQREQMSCVPLLNHATCSCVMTRLSTEVTEGAAIFANQHNSKRNDGNSE